LIAEYGSMTDDAKNILSHEKHHYETIAKATKAIGFEQDLAPYYAIIFTRSLSFRTYIVGGIEFFGKIVKY